MWRVDVDNMPNQMWTLFDENGETLKTDTAPGWYRTSSRAKAERDCARLNAAEAKLWTEQEKAEIDKFAARLRNERGLKAQSRRKIGVLRRSIAAWRAVAGKPLSEYGQAAVEGQGREIRARLAAEKLARTPAAELAVI